MKSDVDWGPGLHKFCKLKKSIRCRRGRFDRGKGGVMDMHRAHLVSNASFVVAMLPALMADRTTLRVV